LAGEAVEALDEKKWSRRDCTEYQDKLDWEMRAFRINNSKLVPSKMSAKMQRAARLREDRVNQEFHRATRIANRTLQAHKGRPREAGGPAASQGHLGELECRDKFLAGHAPAEELEYGESIPMDRWPTLRVANILGVGRPEQSWGEMPGSAEVRLAQSERSQEIGDLRMAGLHIGGAPARLLARGRMVSQPGRSSTPLERNPGRLLSITFSGFSGRVDYRRIETNTQDSDEDALFRQEMRYPYGGAGGFSGIRRADGEKRRASPLVQPLE
jgi:hypothetical protein